MKKFRILSAGLVVGFFSVFELSAAETLHIAVVVHGKSGKEQEIVTGVEAALKDLNGYSTYSVRIQPYRETCNVTEDVEKAAGIAAKKPDMVIGYFCPASAVAVQKEYGGKGIPFFSLSVVAPALTKNPDQNTVRLCSRTDRQFKAFAELLKQRYSDKNLLVLDDSSSSVKNFIKELSERFPASQFKVLTLPLNQANKNIKKLSEVTDFKTDYVIIPSVVSQNAVRLISRVREAGLKMPVIGLNVLGTQEFSQMIGAMKNDVYFFAQEDNRHSVDAANVMAVMRFSDIEPSQETISSYAAVQIWWQANQKDGEKAIRLYDRSYETVMGNLFIDKYGDIQDNFPGMLYKWQENSYVPVY